MGTPSLLTRFIIEDTFFSKNVKFARNNPLQKAY